MERITFFGNHIEKLKKAEEKKQLMAKRQQEAMASIENAGSAPMGNQKGLLKSPSSSPLITSKSQATSTNTFYFYNPTTVSYGQLEFKKNWGSRSAKGYWRMSANTKEILISPSSESELIEGSTTAKASQPTDKFEIKYYLAQLPTEKRELDSINQERNFAYLQLGLIYKEKFKEYALATAKLESVLKQNPEEKLVLPTMYNLYKIYLITDLDKASEMKSQIIAQFPSSRYAQIINNSDTDGLKLDTPEKTYNQLYQEFKEGQFVSVLEKINTAIIQFSGDEIAPKLELLRANTEAKLFGIEAYKKTLEAIAAQYPNTDEGRQAKEIVNDQIPVLEKMEFTTNAKSWKILFKAGLRTDPITIEIEDKIKKFIAEEKIEKRSYSYDVYTDKENFVVIHNIKSEAYAADVIKYMKTNKQYTISQDAIIISSDNYKVVQIKKNLESYLASKKQ